MKAATFVLLVVFGALFATSVEATKDNTITKVVKLLQKMLDKSKKESDDDKNAYAKYKCYVDKNDQEKSDSIKSLGEQIELLESEIAELQARNGELSQQTSQLDRDMAANKAAQKAATTIRDNSAKAFTAMEKDLNAGIGQMKEALDVLGAISLGQTSTGLRKKDTSLLAEGSKTRVALTAVSALLQPKDLQALDSFLQSPLSDVGAAKGDAITGVLKSLKDTFEGNLKSAQDSEKAEKKAFDDSIDTMDKSWNRLDKSNKEKKQEMGDNDGQLGSKKTSYEEAVKQKKEDEDFLDKLRTMAKKKALDYQDRKMMRANEDAAIAEAISILNSDDSFATFGETDATSTGATKAASFLQMGSQATATRRQVSLILERAAAAGHNTRLVRVAAGLRAGNPFTVVLDEIEKMKTVISEEGTADAEQKAWCTKERKNSNTDLDAKKSQIKTLNDAIDKLDETINDPKTGLKVQISDTEESLVENQRDQVEQTKTRNQENAAYQEDVSNLSNAEDILARAIAVLTKYYDALDKKMKGSFVQEDPAPPKTYDAFSGQSDTGGKAIDMLKFIHGETKKEHATADTDEKTAQDDYDTSMGKLKKAETSMEKSIIKLKADLSDKEKELLEKNADLKDTTEAKEAIEDYLSKIKPGCDFIMENFDLREKNRNTETTALNKARDLIKATPAFKSAEKKDAELAAGKCKSECKLDTTNLNCKACMAGSSKKDYCNDHPGMPGCK